MKHPSLRYDQIFALENYAKRQGWSREDPQIKFEVMRLRRGSQCAIFTRKPGREIVTVWGESEKLAKEYLFSLKQQEATI